YYPGVLDVEELRLTAEEQQALSASLAAYRSGDLLAALANYPADRQAASPRERIYHAAILLAVGQVDAAGGLIQSAGAEGPVPLLGRALRKVVSAVKVETVAT